VAHTITRVALTNPGDTGREATESENGDEKAATGQMGRKHTVAYGLYRCHIFLTPCLAADTGFTNADFALLMEALSHMFELDHSASRGEMNARALYCFEHSSKLGNAPSHKLFETVAIASQPEARAFCPERVSAPADGSEPFAGVRCWKLL
jgi:CRISPR-associated protein Csd2